MQNAADVENLARELQHASDFADALQLRLQLEELLANGDADRRSRNYNWISFLAGHTGGFVQAIRAARSSLDLYSSIVDEPDRRLATYTHMLASALASGGQFDEAILYGDRGIELFEKTEHSSDYVAYRRCEVERMRNREPGVYLDRT